MKKLSSIIFIGAILLTACNGEKLKQAEERNVVLGDSLSVALANQDSLFMLINEISDGVNKIKGVENILTSSTDLSTETQSKKEQLRNDIVAIQHELQVRRERLVELEKKLKNSQYYSSTLKKTIENLNAEIAQQQQTITNLQESLVAANIKIEELDMAVDSLNTTVANVTQEKEIAQEESINLANELNTCFYAVGSKSELKEHKIIETGFLKKTKIMKGDFEQSYFTTADKRTLTSIPTHAKKAQILTNQPQDSYEIIDENGLKTIKIINADKFWSLTNYLVIQVN